MEGRASSGVPPEDQCLTVEIEHVIPDLDYPDLPVTACMAHKALVTGGPLDIFSWYDCTAGGGDYPCGSQPSLELTAVKESHGHQIPGDRTRKTLNKGLADVHRTRFRSDGFAQNRNTMVLQPEELVVQVPDNSVTRKTESGNTVWSTVGLSDVHIYQDKSDFDSSWSGFKESVTVSGSDGVAPPGRWRMGLRDDSFQFLDATGSTKVEGNPYNANLIPRDGFTDLKMDFWALGTYKALFEIEATKSGTTYTDSGTYTFHVGPVAELEVRDAPARSLAEPGRRAYTVVARNHGPDTAPAVRVTLTDVPEDAEAITSRGEYVQGACGADGLCQGTWTIGEMVDTVSAEYSGKPDGEVLTIIPASGGSAPLTATIENTQDYSVVIGGTTHSTNYYDYLDHNNEARIASQPGTGRDHPDAPVELKAQEFGALALLRWGPPEDKEVNGWPVTHYEVMRQSGTRWEPLSTTVGGTMYADLNPGLELRAYRVRAVNRFGVPGPWSQPSASGVVGPGNFTATALSDTAIQLSWSRPHGREVTHYEVQYSQDGGNSWGFLAQVAATNEASVHLHRLGSDRQHDPPLPGPGDRHGRGRGVPGSLVGGPQRHHRPRHTGAGADGVGLGAERHRPVVDGGVGAAGDADGL